jgi:2'-5' RNA ligase
MLRLFVGIPLPPAQCLTLSTICVGLHGANWVDPGNYHVTLRFIGEVDEGMAADIDDALQAIRAQRFNLTIAGLDLFGTAERPRTLYAAVDQNRELQALHERVDMAVGRAGLAPEGRRYTPHVTLARFQGGNMAEIQRFIAAHNLLRLDPFKVEEFQLIASYLSRSGAIYEDVAAYPLR